MFILFIPAVLILVAILYDLVWRKKVPRKLNPSIPSRVQNFIIK